MQFNKICILHLNQIGDLLFSLPLLNALKETFPKASIHSVVRPYLQELLSGTPYVDRVILRESSLKAKWALMKNIRKNRYDLLICLGTSEESFILTALSKAKIKAGFTTFPWDLCLDIKEKVEGHKSWYNNARLLGRLNVRISKNDYVGLVNVNKNENSLSLPEKFAIISPAASRRRQIKTWDQEKFAELIILLKSSLDLNSVLVGSVDNLAYNKAIIEMVKEKEPQKEFQVHNLTGKTGLGSLCSIIARARLFVGIDSGIMHLASSIDIPVVGLFGPTDPLYVGPQNARSIVVRNKDMDCMPCNLKHCDHRDCLSRLETNQVLEACRRLLA